MENGDASAHLKESFKAFRDDAIWLRHCYDMYRELYEADGERDALLLRTAGSFFFDLNIILTEYLILQIAKLTDPAMSKVRGGKRDNLTVEYLDASLTKQGLMVPEIISISGRLKTYRNLVDDTRNKLVGHNDLKARLANQSIGRHARQEVEIFFEDLQKYCDAVGCQIGVGPLDFRTQAGPGDVIDLIRVLQSDT